MKIIAKQGTELEVIFKNFFEQAELEKQEVFKMVEEFTGVKPINFGYYWYFGITCKWAIDMITFPEDSCPENMIPYVINHRICYKPNKRLKKSKEFINKWNEIFKGLDGEKLSKYGLPVYDREIGIYSHWIPIKENDEYGISVSSSLIDRMPKIKNKQYRIDI